ncbi:hypothetical protein GCM10009680_36480 [Streptomyces yatensis]|uniref:Uncharacterized protein n=1 Tax=Streptomyces yatensis TaxID=155177 RepID=A0ABN2HUS0_9ACTN
MCVTWSRRSFRHRQRHLERAAEVQAEQVLAANFRKDAEVWWPCVAWSPGPCSDKRSKRNVAPETIRNEVPLDNPGAEGAAR